MHANVTLRPPLSHHTRAFFVYHLPFLMASISYTLVFLLWLPPLAEHCFETALIGDTPVLSSWTSSHPLTISHVVLLRKATAATTTNTAASTARVALSLYCGDSCLAREECGDVGRQRMGPTTLASSVVFQTLVSGTWRIRFSDEQTVAIFICIITFVLRLPCGGHMRQRFVCHFRPWFLTPPPPPMFPFRLRPLQQVMNLPRAATLHVEVAVCDSDGIIVRTAHARAALFDAHGELLQGPVTLSLYSGPDPVCTWPR